MEQLGPPAAEELLPHGSALEAVGSWEGTAWGDALAAAAAVLWGPRTASGGGQLQTPRLKLSSEGSVSCKQTRAAGADIQQHMAWL
jgi:hypothetical protein